MKAPWTPVGILAPVVLAGVCLSCRGVGPADRFEFREVHMGMSVRIVVHAPDQASAERGARAAFARIAALDAALSDYRADSELNRLSATTGVWTSVSGDLFAVLARALEIARLTGGAFDPTVGPLTHLWRESRRTGSSVTDADMARARASVGWQHISTDPAARRVRMGVAGMQLDLGGIAKGFVLQEALTVLDASGLGRALLEAGGDIVVGDPPPGRTGWHIDTPYTDDQSFRARARQLVRAALATSGPVSQFVEAGGVRYSHVLDPRTGRSLTTDRVTAVIARDGATADALATVLAVLETEEAARILAVVPGVLAAKPIGVSRPASR